MLSLRNGGVVKLYSRENFLPAFLIHLEKLSGAHRGGFLASPAVLPAVQEKGAQLVRRVLSLYSSHSLHLSRTPDDPCNPHGIGSGLEYRLHNGVANQSERGKVERQLESNFGSFLVSGEALRRTQSLDRYDLRYDFMSAMRQATFTVFLI